VSKGSRQNRFVPLVKRLALGTRLNGCSKEADCTGSMFDGLQQCRKLDVGAAGRCTSAYKGW